MDKRKFLDDKKREVYLDAIYIINGAYFYAEYLFTNKDLQETCSKLTKKVLGSPVVHVGKKIEFLNKDNDFVFFVRLGVARAAVKKDNSHKGTNCSILTLAWFDDNLMSIPEKIQKYLSTISWDDLARNFFD